MPFERRVKTANMNKGCLNTLIIVLIVLALGAGGTMWFLNAKEQEEDATYKLEKVEVGEVIKKTVATGAVEPRKEVDIKPQISGIISTINVEAGDMVEEGDLLAKVKVIPDMVSLNNAENRVERAKISMKNAEIDFNRNSALLEQGVIAEADILPFQLALNQAQEELSASQDNLSIIREGASRKSSRASTTNIRSTISGMVLSVPVKEGNSVIEANNFNDGTTIASVAAMDDLIFVGLIDESEVEKLSLGMDLIMTIGAIEDRTFNAKLEYISPKGVLDGGAIKFEVKAAVVLEEGEFIRAGYSANVDVVLDRRDDVLIIPESVVQFKGDSVFVEVSVSENVYERRDVKLGLSDGITVEILEGLKEGEELKVWNQPIYE